VSHTANRPSPASLRWDLFCRVIDNLGDAAVCWRLARQLAQDHGQTVRLWIDQPDVLARLVPGARPGRTQQGVRIEAWHSNAPALSSTRRADVADRVIAGFGCELPPAYRSAMRQRRPVWINLEYFSTEAWTQGSHGLPSPKSDGLIEHFFFPGLGPQTGGVLREQNLLIEREAFQRDPWARSEFLARLGLAVQPGQRVASLFAYPDAPWTSLLEGLAHSATPWTVLVPQGILSELNVSELNVSDLKVSELKVSEQKATGSQGSLTIKRIPFLPQDDYDRLLWSCDLNLVRGEDSLIRALWAARPMIWQAYPQAEAAHLPKVAAWLDHLLDAAGTGPVQNPPDDRLDEPAAAIRQAWMAWNADPDAPPAGPALQRALAHGARWQALSVSLCEREASLPSLADRLLAFIESRL